MPDDTKERIVVGAYRALVRDGYNRTTVKDIANEAGVASGLVHYYFHTKEELLVAAIDHACAENMQDQRVGEIHDPLEAARSGIESEKRLHGKVMRIIALPRFTSVSFDYAGIV